MKTENVRFFSQKTIEQIVSKVDTFRLSENNVEITPAPSEPDAFGRVPVTHDIDVCIIGQESRFKYEWFLELIVDDLGDKRSVEIYTVGNKGLSAVFAEMDGSNYGLKEGKKMMKKLEKLLR